MERQPAQQSPEESRMPESTIRSRQRRMWRMRERARHSMDRVLMAYDMARWAVTLAVMSEPNREARRIKRLEARQRMRQRSASRGLLRWQ